MRLYHSVKSIPPTLDDFKSASALGRVLLPPVTERQLDRAQGISCWDNLDAMWRNIRRYPEHGRIVVVLDVPEDGSIRYEQTGRPGHWTVWGPPAVLRELRTGYA